MGVINKYFKLKEFRKDIIILLCIICLPFLFFIYKIVPKDKLWVNNFFILDSGFYEDSQFFIWFICAKLMTLILLSIWFITCIHKWRYTLLFPMIIEILKLHSIIKTWEINSNYNSNIKETLIFSIPFIITILFISNRVNYYNSSKPINEKINNEINNHLIKLSKFDTKYYGSIRKEFIYLKKNKQQIGTKEYLIKLIQLRDKMAI